MMLRTPDGAVECVHDRHRFGVFSRAQWQEAFRRAGFAGAERACRSVAADRLHRAQGVTDAIW